MARLEFGLLHIDGAPLLAHARGDSSTRTLSESLRLLDAEPVVVIDLSDTPLLDAETDHAISERTLRSGCPLIVVVRAGSHAALTLRARTDADLIVVERASQAAVRVARIRRQRRAWVDHEPERHHRYQVRRSV